MESRPPVYDVIILGAGGAGLFCGQIAGNRGLKVLILDHSKKLGGKILISGGGRCNFTNLGAGPKNYVSENEHFAKSALARFTPQDFVALVEKHGIAYHEKKLGQQFCDGSAQQIVNMLESEAREAGCEIRLQCEFKPASITETAAGFSVATNQGVFEATSLVVATGGLSIPKIGATGIGYEIAKKFGLKVIPTRAALDGFTFGPREQQLYGDLAGVATDVLITTQNITFREAVLFTHAGLSGPATLQASLHWEPGSAVRIQWLPDVALDEWFIQKKKSGSNLRIKNALGELLPSRLADRLYETCFQDSVKYAETGLSKISDSALKDFSQAIQNWTFVPSGTVGYSKAEVTRGGVDTSELSSKTLESKKKRGLYFIGEVVDVTGWLGGYNFQWAWASAAAAGSSLVLSSEHGSPKQNPPQTSSSGHSAPGR